MKTFKTTTNIELNSRNRIARMLMVTYGIENEHDIVEWKEKTGFSPEFLINYIQGKKPYNTL